MKYVYNTTGTCCKQFGIEVEDNKLVNLEFVGGCNGNLQGICALVKGMDIDEIIGKLRELDAVLVRPLAQISFQRRFVKSKHVRKKRSKQRLGNI